MCLLSAGSSLYSHRNGFLENCLYRSQFFDSPINDKCVCSIVCRVNTFTRFRLYGNVSLKISKIDWNEHFIWGTRKHFMLKCCKETVQNPGLRLFFCFKIKFKSFILNSISFIGVFAEFCFFFFLKHVIWTLWIEELAIIVEFEEIFYLQNIVLMNRKQFGFSTYAITLLWVTIFRFTDRTRFPPKGEIGFGAAFIEVDPMDTMDIVCPKYNSNSEHSVEKEWLIVYQVWGIFLTDFFLLLCYH